MNAGSTRRDRVYRSGRIVLFLTLVIVSWAGSRARASDSAAEGPDGEELFRTHCASCHGVDATGSGPLARLLRHQPSDLTQLSRRNGGMFPGARVRRIVEGRDVESHGDRDMPVWGDVFRKGAVQSAEDAAARLNAIVRYLETIQSRQAQ